jgi:threonine dehydratase
LNKLPTAGHRATPCVASQTLSQLTGAQIYLKFENLQYTASFKERGACNKLAQLTQAERQRGVIAMSAGNHAQGVAYHAQRLGIRAVIVMPRFTPGVKVGARAAWREVVPYGDTLDGRAAPPGPRARTCVFHPTTTKPSVGQGTVQMMQARGPDMLVIAGAAG